MPTCLPACAAPARQAVPKFLQKPSTASTPTMATPAASARSAGASTTAAFWTWWRWTRPPTTAWTISATCATRRPTPPAPAIIRYISSTRCTCSPQRPSTRLLKTLEEPPAHVIFILATTEIQKVPATILSRCQRYDFTRIGPEDIARRVEYIAGEEQLELTADGTELDCPPGGRCAARRPLYSGHLRGRDGEDRRRRGAPDGGRHRPQLPVPHFGRHRGRRTVLQRWPSWPSCGSSRWT